MLPKKKPTEQDQLKKILDEDFSEDFIQKMRNRVMTSHFKYGPARDSFKKVNAVATAMLELVTYLETGNREYLVDAANYIMFEYMFPALPHSHFHAGDSHQSAGTVQRKFSSEVLENLMKEHLK